LARAGNTTQTQICSCKGYEGFGDAWLASRRPLRGLENVPWRWSGQVELLLTQLPLRQCRPPVRVRWSNLEDRANGTVGFDPIHVADHCALHELPCLRIAALRILRIVPKGVGGRCRIAPEIARKLIGSG